MTELEIISSEFGNILHSTINKPEPRVILIGSWNTYYYTAGSAPYNSIIYQSNFGQKLTLVHLFVITQVIRTSESIMQMLILLYRTYRRLSSTGDCGVCKTR